MTLTIAINCNCLNQFQTWTLL